MATFRATQESTAVVAASRQAIWEVITDPDLLCRLTPLLQSIETDGDTWRWRLMPIPALGLTVVPAFTEAMTFHPPERIEFAHTPPPGVRERAGVDGWYALDEVGSDDEPATRLQIRLGVVVDLPVSRLARPAVQTVMTGVMARMGSGFGAHLCDHLGVPRSPAHRA